MDKIKQLRDTARPLGVRGHQRKSRLIAVNKSDGAMFVESRHEHITALALDIDPRTKHISPQPFTLRLDLERLFATKKEALKATPRISKKRRDAGSTYKIESIYTPDFLVELSSPTPLVVECKTGFQAKKLQVELIRRGQILSNLGYRYQVISTEQLDYKGLHVNLVNLRDAIHYPPNEEIKQGYLGALERFASRRNGPFPASEIRRIVPDQVLYLGLAYGVIACDLRSGHISNETIVWRAYGDLAHLQLLNLEYAQ